jgi:low affinity Fe/Cu permease
MKKKTTKGPSWFERMSGVVTRASGSTPAFLAAILVIIAWLASGPIFHYSDTWQLVINTGTTIITFLMVFLIQRSQNKDSVAIHLKLNELVVAHELANNRLVSIEDISEDELRVLQKYYRHLADMTMKELSLEESHSIDAAVIHHQRKHGAKKKKQGSETPGDDQKTS